MKDVKIEDTAMPIPTLAEALAEYGGEAYLLTMTTDGPHTSSVAVELKDNVIACTLGKSAAKNIAAMPNVSLFWPPREPGGYALILNGTAVASNGARAEITLTKSVLHSASPSPAGSDGPYRSKCRRVARPG